jgi:hypothetical protein
LDRKADKDSKVLTELMGLREIRDYKVSKVKLDRREIKVPKGTLDSKGYLGSMEPREIKVFKD